MPVARGAVPLDPSINPGFLKLDLLCRGIRLTSASDAAAIVCATSASSGSTMHTATSR